MGFVLDHRHMVSGKRLRLFLSSIFLVILTFHSLQMFAGNSDRYTVQINYLEPAIEAQYIKIVPNEWRNQISLRLELYGCSEGRKSRIGIVRTTRPRYAVSDLVLSLKSLSRKIQKIDLYFGCIGS